jgi:hypothetical protein
MQSVSIMGGQAVKLCFISTSPPAHRHPQKFSAGPSWNLWTSGQRDCPRFLDELYRVCSTAGTTRLSEDTASELLVRCGGECELSIQLGIFKVRLGARPINVILGGIRL